MNLVKNIIKIKLHKQNGTLKSFMQIRLNYLLLNILCTLLIALDILKIRIYFSHLSEIR